jgi:hypothetical protein
MKREFEALAVCYSYGAVLLRLTHVNQPRKFVADCQRSVLNKWLDDPREM